MMVLVDVVPLPAPQSSVRVDVNSPPFQVSGFDLITLDFFIFNMFLHYDYVKYEVKDKTKYML